MLDKLKKLFFGSEVKPEARITGHEAKYVVFDEAADLTEEQWSAPTRKKPKQMKSRSRKK